MQHYLNTHIGENICSVLDCTKHNIDINSIATIIDYLEITISIPNGYNVYYQEQKNKIGTLPYSGFGGYVGATGPRGNMGPLPLLCNYCNILSNNQHDAQQHRDVCPMMPIMCLFCWKSSPKYLANDHKNNCLYRPITCQYCNQEFKWIYWIHHMMKCSYCTYCPTQDIFYLSIWKSLHLKICNECNNANINK